MPVTDLYEAMDPQRLKLIYSASGELVGLQSTRANGNFRQRVAQNGDIQLEDGTVFALSEVITESLALTPSATTTVLSGPGNYSHYRCTVAAGNITVYDSLTASGKVLVPTTALAVGVFPVFGPGHSGRLAVTIGITVVLSGAATVYVGNQAG